MVSSKVKLGDLLAENQVLLHVINRLGIRLGFGEKTVEELTAEFSIDTEFFVELCNLVLSEGKLNPKYIERFKTDWTILYLRKSHAAYLSDYLVRIEKYIENIKMTESERESDIAILINFFRKYKKEFTEHLNYEDNTIFPYIKKLEEHYDRKDFDSEIIKSIKRHSVKNYIKHHDSLHVQLNDLKSLMIKYFSPFQNEVEIINGLTIMFELEKDLKSHELIENHILFPKVITMENTFLNLTKH